MAPAGAGTPTKYHACHSGRAGPDSATLNRAKRRAAEIAKISATIHPKDPASSSAQVNSRIAGATPKLTKSASESSSAPNRDVDLRKRAT